MKASYRIAGVLPSSTHTVTVPAGSHRTLARGGSRMTSLLNTFPSVPRAKKQSQLGFVWGKDAWSIDILTSPFHAC